MKTVHAPNVMLDAADLLASSPVLAYVVLVVVTAVVAYKLKELF